jgi:Ca2+-binding EF-hand superfamily protein
MDLLRKFNALSAKLESWAKERDTSLRSTDYGDSISACTAKLNNLDAFESEYSAQTDRVVQLKSVAGQLQQESYQDMSTVNNRVGSIEGVWGTLKQTSSARRSALQAHLARLHEIENLLLSFAKRGLEFRVWLEKAEDVLTEPITGETPSAVAEFQSQHDSIKQEKQEKEAEFGSLGQLAQNCKSAGVPENTYSEVSFSSLESHWNDIVRLLSSRQDDIAAEMQKQETNENLRVQFAQLASTFDGWTKQQSSAIESLSGDIQSQLSALQNINQAVSGGQGQFAQVQQAHQALENAHVFDNPHTALSIEGLKSQWDALNTLSHKKQQVLEKELLEQSGSGLSAEQLKEFRECFKHFDKDEDSLLSRLELGACLKSLGEDLSFEEGGKLDQILTAIDADGDGKVNFEEFAGYMERVSSGSDTPDSIKLAFRTLAGDKDFVTEADLRAVLPAEKVAYCLAHMKPYPGSNGGYDYNSFTDNQLYGK